MDILDKKTKEELQKHKSNFYAKNIINRNKINTTIKFNPLKLSKTDIFLVNIRKFSGFEGSYYFSGKDPLVNTALQLLKNKVLKLEESYLFKYYEDFQPKTYGEVYYLNKNNKLHLLDSTNHFHPWIHNKPTNKFRSGLFGPKDISNVQHRVIRLRNLITNIKKYGYSPSNNDIVEGYILLKKNDYRFLITGGHHRIAVLTAMYINGNKSFEDILVKYELKRTKIRIVREEEVKEWSGVKSGYLSKDDAIEIFNKFFN